MTSTARKHWQAFSRPWPQLNSRATRETNKWAHVEWGRPRATKLLLHDLGKSAGQGVKPEVMVLLGNGGIQRCGEAGQATLA